MKTLVSQYVSLKRTVKDLEAQIRQLEDQIKEAMGEREEVLVDGLTVRWKTYTQNRFDTTAFRQQHEALYERFVVSTEVRRFTVT